VQLIRQSAPLRNFKTQHSYDPQPNHTIYEVPENNLRTTSLYTDTQKDFNETTLEDQIHKVAA